VQRQLNGERIIFSTNGAGKCTSICNKMNLDTPDTLLKNSKWIIELNVKYKTITLLEENTEEFCILGLKILIFRS